jgi:hypothetical protein
MKASSFVSKTVWTACAIEKCGGDVVLSRPTMKITFRYAGPEVDSGSMDIEEVIEALQGFAGAYGKVANELDAPEAAHQVKVIGFDKGSFEVYLAAGISLLSQDGSPVRTFLNLVDSAKIIFEIIGNVILAKKETKGRKDYKVEVKGDGNLVLISGDNAPIVIGPQAFDIFKRGLIDRDLSKIVDPLLPERVDSAELIAEPEEGPDPDWFKYLSMRKLAVTTPNVLRNLRFIDHDAARPYNFAISPVLSLSNTALVAPFCDKPSRWDGLTYVCVDTGEKGKLNNWVLYVDGKIVPLVKQTMEVVIGKYSKRPEFKSLAPDGSPCTKNTVGLLRCRPVIAKPVFQLIGKEVDRGTSEDAYMMEGEKLVRYPHGETLSFPKALAKLSDREIARRAVLDSQTVSRMRNRKTGKTARHESWVKLMRFAKTLTKA